MAVYLIDGYGGKNHKGEIFNDSSLENTEKYPNNKWGWRILEWQNQQLV